jgi:hypothetical protein
MSHQGVGEPVANDRPILHSIRAGFLLLAMTCGTTAGAAQVVVNGPQGSESFGGVFGDRSITVLPNGNFVVIDALFDAPGPIADVGAVYLYRPDGVLISTLTGSTENDRVGLDGIVVLPSGNFVVRSPGWDNGPIRSAGAATFVSGTTGLSGVVSPLNSLVGTNAFDSVGGSIEVLGTGNYVVAGVGGATFGSGLTGVRGVRSAANSLVSNDDADFFAVTPLRNGHYVVSNFDWDNGAATDAGAATFGSGSTGVVGLISPANSLVGTTANSWVGQFVYALSNGNYVVSSPEWRTDAAADLGAVTFGSGTSGVRGAVSVANSLVGTSAGDAVGGGSVGAFGRDGVVALTDGNYVVVSPTWNNGATVDAGAATFGSGSGGISGAVSPVNSLVGSTAQDRVGSGGVRALSNGSYVVRSVNWSNGAAANAGAATFGPGTTGITGLVAPANSLVGSATGDAVGSGGVFALSNGSYVVSSPAWDSGSANNAGAATFGSGSTGVSGAVSQLNSLVGNAPGDAVSIGGITALSNGNYVVLSRDWDNGAATNAGAATFGSGTTGVSGLVSPANSLAGTAAGDAVSAGGVVALINGNYVVSSPDWDSGAATNAGAATFAPGSTGISGTVSPTNSLIGSTAQDRVGSSGIAALTSGSYVVGSPGWDNGATANVGAATFGSATNGISGMISAANSLVGTRADDSVSGNGVVAIDNGNYVVKSFRWDNGAAIDGGAVTLGLAGGSVVGPITDEHSVLGQGQTFVEPDYAYDALRNQLIVGQPFDSRAVLQRTGLATAISIVGETPDPSAVGELVTFTALVTATPNAPGNGQVTFRASTGEACTDPTPTAVSPGITQFSCAFAFATQGQSTVVAEYTGSLTHAYSGSGPESHTSTPAVNLFTDGFELP